MNVPGQQPCLDEAHNSAAVSLLIACLGDGLIWGVPERSVPLTTRVVSCTLDFVNIGVLLVVLGFDVAMRVVETAGVVRGGGVRREGIGF